MKFALRYGSRWGASENCMRLGCFSTKRSSYYDRMRHLRRCCPAVFFFVGAALAFAYLQNDEPADAREVRLPNGQRQQEAMLKADYERSLKEADQLTKLAESLKSDLEKNDRHVLSLATLKKTEEIEKLARRIRGRLRRF